MATKKLIEVALPLDKINAASAREKSIRHGHPSTLHLWWARRPLAAARAVIWSSLVDDPSSHPELFPTEEDQNRERQRLFKILEDLVVWENSNNQDVLNAAKAEIMKSTNGNPPALLDPFAGGGAIPLEAQRLGLEAHAHDLNPVAVMINKAMIEIPPIFANMPPVNPDDRVSQMSDSWHRSYGLASDVNYYGEILKKKAYEIIGASFPKYKLSKEFGGDQGTVISWIWYRTVICPNPICRCELPLASSFYISKKKGKEAWIQPINNGKLCFKMHYSGKPEVESTVSRKGAVCPFCGMPVDFTYLRDQAKQGEMKACLAAVVVEGKKGRFYCEPTEEQIEAAQVPGSDTIPMTELPEQALGFRVQNYGILQYRQLFTNRQQLVLKTLVDLLPAVFDLIRNDAIQAGLSSNHDGIDKHGNGAHAYAQAICVYLSFVIDKLADIDSSLSTWINTIGAIRNTFARQALSMKWDFAEANPFSNATGCYSNMLNWVVKCLLELPSVPQGYAEQFAAQQAYDLSNVMISTDPPYYDNIGYADLSDFFYLWMRQGLKKFYPELFNTLVVPKSEELIATPFRFSGNMDLAKKFFENGMIEACTQIKDSSCEDIPITIYYAYKQTEADEELDSSISSGWETILAAIIIAGLTITGTWPISTERSNRPRGLSSNALATSVVLVCRKRNDNRSTTRRSFINELRRELRPALRQLQGSNIAPVDLAQSAIGPGMGVFTRYYKVLEADGTPMSVRNALHVINEEVDLYFNEQISDLDAMSRFCVDLYTQNAFNDIKFGEADVLARAKGTSVAALTSHDVVYAKAGTVHLIERMELPKEIDENESCIWLLTQQLTQAMATGGVEACAKAVFTMFGSNAEKAKDLAYRLYTIAELKKWASEAFAYNALVVAWPDILSRAAMMQREKPEQLDLFNMGLLDS